MPPQNLHFGWAGPEAAKRAWGMLAKNFRPFRIVGDARPADGKRVCLWEAAKAVLGDFVPNINQQIGDCVSWGCRNAVDHLQCVEIALRGERETYRGSFPPYFYGISRVQIGGQRGSYDDGSVGSWAADGVQKYGVLAVDDPNVPKYSGNVAKEWGAKGPPQEFIDLAKRHPVRSAAMVKTYAEVRDAIANGYPVTVASGQGFSFEGRESGGKLWWVPEGSWQHQMCFIAVDDDPARPGCFCLNSWGARQWPNQPDGAPPGGGWVDAKIVERMVSGEDSFAFSQFDGFPAQAINWSQF